MEETILESTQWIMEMDAIRKSKNARNKQTTKGLVLNMKITKKL